MAERSKTDKAQANDQDAHVGPASQLGRTPDSIRDFMTDGTLLALCEEFSRLTGAPVWLRDRTGEAIVLGNAERAWGVVPPAEGAARAARAAGAPEHDPGTPAHTAPIRVGGITIGELVMLEPGGDAPADPDALARALELLAAHVTEACEARASLQLRVRDLKAMLSLSASLARARDDDASMGAALELAITTLGADAGSVALVDEGAETLTLRTWRGLSEEWLAERDRERVTGELSKRAMEGEVVCVEDLTRDEPSPIKEQAAREGLHGFACAGLNDHGRPVGLIRLYTKRPRLFTPTEGELLRSMAQQLAAALANTRLLRLREEDERMQRQIRIAGAVQRRMLPVRMPMSSKFDLAARYVPSFELGGDFYDFIDLGGHLGIAVGDVVGKGVPAALLMSAVRASLRAHAQDVYDIGEVLRRVNVALTDDTLDNEFTTLWYAVADPFTLGLTHCSAGHEWPVVIRAEEGVTPTEEHVQRLTTDGMVLGIDRDQRYAAGRFQMRPGDIILAYTDGLPDATNFEGKRYGGKRVRGSVLELLANEPEATSAEIVEHVFWALRQFHGLNQRLDDMTLTVMRVRRERD